MNCPIVSEGLFIYLAVVGREDMERRRRAAYAQNDKLSVPDKGGSTGTSRQRSRSPGPQGAARSRSRSPGRNRVPETVSRSLSPPEMRFVVIVLLKTQ